MATTYLNPPRQLLLGEEDALNASGYALSAATGTKIFAAQFVATLASGSKVMLAAGRLTVSKTIQ